MNSSYINVEVPGFQGYVYQPRINRPSRNSRLPYANWHDPRFKFT